MKRDANGHLSANGLDRLIGYFSPRQAARRMQFRNFIAQIYEGANFSTGRSYIPVQPLDQRFTAPAYTRLTLLSHARYLYANLGFVRGAVNDLRRYSVGPKGLVPESLSENEPWATEASDFFTEWCKIADATNRYSFGELQRMAVLVAALDGDCGMILTKTKTDFPKLQFIEGHQIQDNGKQKQSVDGILIDDANEPVGYRVLTSNANGVRVAQTVDPANFIHFYDPERYTGTRGVSWLAHLVNNGRDIFDLVTYEKRFLHNACSRTLMQTTETGGVDDGETHLADGTPDLDPDKPSVGPNVEFEHLEGGTIDYFRAGAGTKLRAFQFDRPTAAFREFMDYLEGDGYIGLGLPVNWKNLHKEGGATCRAALVKAQRRFDEIEANVEQRICNRVWNWVTAVGANQKRIGPRPKDAYRVRWHGPAKATVDAGREAVTNRDDLKMGMRTYIEDLAERGITNWKAHLRQVAREEAFITALAVEFKEARENIQQRTPNVVPPSEERLTVG